MRVWPCRGGDGGDVLFSFFCWSVVVVRRWVLPPVPCFWVPHRVPCCVMGVGLAEDGGEGGGGGMGGLPAMRPLSRHLFFPRPRPPPFFFFFFVLPVALPGGTPTVHATTDPFPPPSLAAAPNPPRGRVALPCACRSVAHPSTVLAPSGGGGGAKEHSTERNSWTATAAGARHRAAAAAAAAAASREIIVDGVGATGRWVVWGGGGGGPADGPTRRRWG